MKIKEYATERIKDIQEFLKEDGIEESRKNLKLNDFADVGKMLKVWKIGGSNEERKGIRDRN
ncbi:hypothetical protein ACW0TN_06480 [Fusobacterium pseudoperiodonticum]